MGKGKAWLVFAWTVQVIQGVLLLLFWNMPVKESVFLPELLELVVSDPALLQKEQIYALVIGLAAWLAVLGCLAGLGRVYREKILPGPWFYGIVFGGFLLYAGAGRWVQAAGSFRLWMLFLKADLLAWILIGMILAGKIRGRRKKSGG